jgi:hypothetical protein
VPLGPLWRGDGNAATIPDTHILLIMTTQCDLPLITAQSIMPIITAQCILPTIEVPHRVCASG